MCSKAPSITLVVVMRFSKVGVQFCWMGPLAAIEGDDMSIIVYMTRSDAFAEYHRVAVP